MVIPSRNGTITAQEAGEATVTAYCGKYSAKIHVTVTPYFESLKFIGAFLNELDKDEPIDDEVYEVELKSGEVLNCQKLRAEMWVTTDGFYPGDDGKFTGNRVGTALILKCPMFYAPKELNPGADGNSIISLGRYRAGGSGAYSDTTVHIGSQGHITDLDAYMQQMELFCDQYNKYISSGDPNDYRAVFDYVRDAAEYIDGSVMETLHYYTTDEGVESTGYYLPNMPDALVDSAFFSLTGEGITEYTYGLEFFYTELKFLDGLYGCNIETNQRTGNVIMLDHELHTYDKTYKVGEPYEDDEEEESNEAPKAAVRIRMPNAVALPERSLSDMPMLKYALENQISRSTKR